MTGFLHSLLSRGLGTADPRPRQIDSTLKNRAAFRKLTDVELRQTFVSAKEITVGVAVAAVAAERVLGLELFPEQIRGALALVDGRIAEMQTGEGKTLAAVPAVAWLARNGKGFNVMKLFV